MSRLCQRCLAPINSSVEHRGTYQTVGSIGGSIGGSMVGSSVGRAVGSVAGPVGAAVGSIGGMIGGAIGGSNAGARGANAVCDAVDTNRDTVCKACKAQVRGRSSWFRGWGNSEDGSAAAAASFSAFSGEGHSLGNTASTPVAAPATFQAQLASQARQRNVSRLVGGPAAAEDVKTTQMADDEVLARQLQVELQPPAAAAEPPASQQWSVDDFSRQKQMDDDEALARQLQEEDERNR